MEPSLLVEQQQTKFAVSSQKPPGELASAGETRIPRDSMAAPTRAPLTIRAIFLIVDLCAGLGLKGNLEQSVRLLLAWTRATSLFGKRESNMGHSFGMSPKYK